MTIYNYDKETNEFLGESEARLSPLEEDVYLIPAFATSITPLKAKEGFSQIFNENEQKWEYVEDNREKTIYIKATKEELKVDYLGKIKDEHTLLNPKQFDEWDYTQKQWIENIEKKETQRIQQIEVKCNQVIEAIYSIYKQINITNLLTPYTAEDRDTMKAFINSKRAICHKAISDGANAENINWEVIND